MTDNVIEIEELRITRKRRAIFAGEGCQHMHLTIDRDGGDVITCDDCSRQVSAIWVLQHFADQFEKARARFKRDQQAVTEREKKTVVLKAALEVESAWRSRTMVPTCPHCHEAIFASDGFGRSAANRQMAERRRAEQHAARQKEAQNAGQ